MNSVGHPSNADKCVVNIPGNESVHQKDQLPTIILKMIQYKMLNLFTCPFAKR